MMRFANKIIDRDDCNTVCRLYNILGNVYIAHTHLEHSNADSRQFYVVEVNRETHKDADTKWHCSIMGYIDEIHSASAFNNDCGKPILSVNFSCIQNAL